MQRKHPDLELDVPPYELDEVTAGRLAALARAGSVAAAGRSRRPLGVRLAVATTALLAVSVGGAVAAVTWVLPSGEQDPTGPPSAPTSELVPGRSPSSPAGSPAVPGVGPGSPGAPTPGPGEGASRRDRGASSGRPSDAASDASGLLPSSAPPSRPADAGEDADPGGNGQGRGRQDPGENGRDDGRGVRPTEPPRGRPSDLPTPRTGQPEQPGTQGPGQGRPDSPGDRGNRPGTLDASDTASAGDS
ncbi:hypothetical protein [Nocardioides nanhaiensis]|uniref:Translation initiation factor IF-2 n=1 Tax=Nocardioides nanhaiensis TaxID=1476871 RepID=A0ABP8W3J3_9ACTN